MSKKYIIGNYNNDLDAYETIAIKEFECVSDRVRVGEHGPYLTKDAIESEALSQDDNCWGDTNSLISGKNAQINGDIYLTKSRIHNASISGNGLVSKSAIILSSIALERMGMISGSSIQKSGIAGIKTVKNADIKNIDADLDRGYLANSKIENCTLDGNTAIDGCRKGIQNCLIKDSVLKDCHLQKANISYARIEGVDDYNRKNYEISGKNAHNRLNISGPTRIMKFRALAKDKKGLVEKLQDAGVSLKEDTPNQTKLDMLINEMRKDMSKSMYELDTDPYIDVKNNIDYAIKDKNPDVLNHDQLNNTNLKLDAPVSMTNDELLMHMNQLKSNQIDNNRCYDSLETLDALDDLEPVDF